MSYVGNITVLDEGGNMVFEQKLTQDQIIEALIASRLNEGTEEQEEVGKQPKPTNFERYIPGSNRLCGCGPTGRHKKVCKLAGSGVKPAPKTTPAKRDTFDEEEKFVPQLTRSSSGGYRAQSMKNLPHSLSLTIWVFRFQALIARLASKNTRTMCGSSAMHRIWNPENTWSKAASCSSGSTQANV
jgi:hypothetical protein